MHIICILSFCRQVCNNAFRDFSFMNIYVFSRFAYGVLSVLAFLLFKSLGKVTFKVEMISRLVLNEYFIQEEKIY